MERCVQPIDAPWLRTRRGTRVARPARPRPPPSRPSWPRPADAPAGGRRAHAAVWVIPSTGARLPHHQPTARQTATRRSASTQRGNEYEAAQVVAARRRRPYRHLHVGRRQRSADHRQHHPRPGLLRAHHAPQPTAPARGDGLVPGPAAAARASARAFASPDSTHAFYLLRPTCRTARRCRRSHGDAASCERRRDVWTIPFSAPRVELRLAAPAQTPVGLPFNQPLRPAQRRLRSVPTGWRRNGATRAAQHCTACCRQYGITTLDRPVCPQATSARSHQRDQLRRQHRPVPRRRRPLHHDAPPLDPVVAVEREDATAPSSPRLLTYLTEVCRRDQAEHGWQDKAYAYIVDEPMTTAPRSWSRSATRASLHRRRPQSGFRVQLPAHRRPAAAQPRRRQAGQRIPLRRRRHLGRALLLLLRARDAERGASSRRRQGDLVVHLRQRPVAKIPNYVIEKPNTDQRVWGWLMEQWNVDGPLNWGLNEWLNPRAIQQNRGPVPGHALVLARDARPTATARCLPRLLPPLRA